VPSLLARFRYAKLPLVPLLPAIVVVVGVTTALIVGLLGAAQLRATSDAVAADRARVLAATLAHRLRATSSEDHGQVIRRAAGRSGAEILIAAHDGTATVDATYGAPDNVSVANLLSSGRGETVTRIGRTFYAVEPLGAPFQNLAVVAFVPAPSQPEGARALLRSVLALTGLLVGVAAVVAFVFGRDLHADVDFVREQIVMMAEPSSSPTGMPVPVRVADQVGLLTDAFNVLVDRFAAAERAYREDLSRVASLDRDRSAFLGALSHELRTPLNAILGFTDILLSEVDGPLDPDARENLEMVRASGSHLRGLIDDILELSAIESGQLHLSRALVDVHSIAQDVVREATARIERKPITLAVTGISPTLAHVDERRIWQVLSNLVGNAIKFTERGTVNVDVRMDQASVVMTVTDTGPGISPGEIDAIFHEYRQAGPAHARRKGTGLGLFIAKRLVTMHGGTISVRSRLGHGSTFVVRIPAFAVEPQEPDAVPSAIHVIETEESS
jgi:signal transduction histidine kinase